MNFRDPREKRAWPNLDNRNLTQGSAENRKKTSGRPVFRSRLMLKEAAMALSETRSQQSTRRTEGKPQKRQSRSLVSRPRVETGHPEYRIGVLRARSRRSEYMVCRQVSRMCLSAYSCQPELPSLIGAGLLLKIYTAPQLINNSPVLRNRRFSTMFTTADQWEVHSDISHIKNPF